MICFGFARRKIEQEYAEKPKNNIIIVAYDIERILDVFSENDKIDRIYINFCNPWPKPRHRKKRLTNTRQLENYKVFLNENSEIYFKTDDDMLFKDSLVYFNESGFELVKKTDDLHSEKNIDNICTEHEEMFSNQGIKIKAAIFKYKGGKNHGV